MQFKKIIISLVILLFTFGFICDDVHATHGINSYIFANETESETSGADETNETEQTDETDEEADDQNNSETDENSDSDNKSSDNNAETTEPYYMDSNCTDIAPALRIGNLIIRIVRLVVPLVIIIMGTFKLFSAVLAGTPGALADKGKELFQRVILAVLIFFAPNIINAFTKVMTTDENADINICRKCLLESDCPESEDIFKSE